MINSRTVKNGNGYVSSIEMQSNKRHVSTARNPLGYNSNIDDVAFCQNVIYTKSPKANDIITAIRVDVEDTIRNEFNDLYCSSSDS